MTAQRGKGIVSVGLWDGGEGSELRCGIGLMWGAGMYFPFCDLDGRTWMWRWRRGDGWSTMFPASPTGWRDGLRQIANDIRRLS